MNILGVYMASKNLPMAKRYLELNRIKSFSVERATCPDNNRKPWRVWENTGEEINAGFPVGEFRLKRDAVKEGKALAAFVSLPFRIS
jgi:hypothetical protein